MGTLAALGAGSLALTERTNHTTEENPMADGFEKGEVVKLKSGGPKMTVHSEKHRSSKLICVWFDGTERKSGSFHPETLKKADQN